MTIYNINFGIGWASSGVEYAQKYRAELIRNRDYPLKFIFLDFIDSENIQTLTSNLGFQDKEIIWLYQYFTDIEIAPTTYTTEEIIKTLSEPIIRIEHHHKIKRIFFKNAQTFVTCYLKDTNEDYVDRAEFVSNGMLIRKDYYSYVRLFSEIYAPSEKKAQLYMRQFYNEDGSIAYEEYVNADQNNNMYVINHQPLYGRIALIAYFLQSLKLTAADILIIDRATDIGQAVLQNKGQSKVGVVVHAEHYSKNATNDDTILWNNFYEYQFKQAQHIDFFITATDQQNQLLSDQFKHYYQQVPRIYTIPVGSLSKLRTQKERKPYAIITASRLATEKHVDWIVRAVVKARQQIPVFFDIYGEGTEKEKISRIITELNAEDYIHLKGHVDLSEVYKAYELFITASQSEGFGLTLMEAVGSGLGMIGFDVNYGNPTFIRDNQNGYLIPFNLDEEQIEHITDVMAEKIVSFFEKEMKDVQKVSYEIAETFRKEQVMQQWNVLIDEVLNA